jgi:hypothetical protein
VKRVGEGVVGAGDGVVGDAVEDVVTRAAAGAGVEGTSRKAMNNPVAVRTATATAATIEVA